MSISKLDFSKLLNLIAVFIITLSFIFACFFPANVGPTRLENFLLPLAVIVLCLAKKVRIDLGFFSVLVIFFLLSVFSVLIHEPDMVKFSYTIRMLKFIVIFVMVGNVAYNNLKIFDISIRITFWFVAIITVIEAFNLYGMYNDILFPFFSHRERWEFMWTGRRLIGTMENPNNFAVMLLCFIAYFLSSYYYRKNWWDLVFVCCCVISLILAQSRTAFIALILMSMVFLLNFRLKKSLILGLITITILVIAVMNYLKMDYLMQVFTRNPLEIGELTSRFKPWAYMYEIWKENIFFGAGPFAHKMDELTGTPDNEYIYMLAKNGLFGLMSYLTVLLYPVIILWKRRKDSLHAMLGILLPVGFSVIALTNFTILNVRIGLIYFILIGIPISILIYDKKNPYRFSKTIPGITNLFKKRPK